MDFPGFTYAYSPTAGEPDSPLNSTKISSHKIPDNPCSPFVVPLNFTPPSLKSPKSHRFLPYNLPPPLLHEITPIQHLPPLPATPTSLEGTPRSNRGRPPFSLPSPLPLQDPQPSSTAHLSINARLVTPSKEESSNPTTIDTTHVHRSVEIMETEDVREENMASADFGEIEINF